MFKAKERGKIDENQNYRDSKRCPEMKERSQLMVRGRKSWQLGGSRLGVSEGEKERVSV
jgi:hypothetical protein